MTINMALAVPINIRDYEMIGSPDVIYATTTSHYDVNYGVHYDKTTINSTTYLKLERPDGSIITYDIFQGEKDIDIPITYAEYVAGGTTDVTSEVNTSNGVTWEILTSKRIDITLNNALNSGDELGFLIGGLTTAGSTLYVCEYDYECTQGVDDIGYIEIDRVGYNYITLTGVNNQSQFTIMNDNVGKVTIDRIFGIEVNDIEIYNLGIDGANITHNIINGQKYGTYWWTIETYDGIIIDRQGVFIQELTSEELGKVLQFHPQGVWMAEVEEWIENEWSFHATEDVTIDDMACIVELINGTNIQVIPIPYTETIDSVNNKITVKWYADNNEILEGYNYGVTCDINVTVGGTHTTLTGIEQYVYINRQKTFWAKFMEMWDKILGIEIAVEETYNKTIQIENNTLEIKTDTEYIISQLDNLTVSIDLSNTSIELDNTEVLDEIGYETNASLKELLTRPVMSIVH